MMLVNNNTIKNLVEKVVVYVDVKVKKNAKIIQHNVIKIGYVQMTMVNMYVKRHVEHVIEMLVIQNVHK